MFVHFVSALAIASTLVAQTPMPDAQAAAPVAQNAPATTARNLPANPNAAAPAASSITLPAGTAIALTLMTPVKSKSTKAGDSVRAVVAFPVTQGTQLAIPAGTYAEGEVQQVTSRPMSNQQPSFRVHFTRLVFANGYSVPLDAQNTQALLLSPDAAKANDEIATLSPFPAPIGRFAMGEGQSSPTLPPLPQEGPNPAVIGGIMAGAVVAFGIGMFAYMHHRVNTYDYVLFDAGWQFQMVLDSPITLDPSRVAAAIAATNVN